MAVPAAAAAVDRIARVAFSVGKAAAGHLWGRFRDQAGNAAVANLKLTMAVLFTGLGFTMAVVVLPVAMVALALTAGISRGLPIATAQVPAGPPLAPGQLACPVPGAVLTQPFGPSALPGEPAYFGYPHFHTGLDLAIAEGTPIRAAEGGEVLQAAGQTNSLGLLVGYGNLVRIAAPGGRVDYYGHMSGFAVGRGDVVGQYQVIGYVGSTGYSTGPHVHLEVRVDGTPVDPAPFVQRC